ncbi:hypothetical protein [Streptomyces sp. TLI_105]|uniref:hypothetical protein n=1 Tax=Streptomyces sp. TLI_105 TaxID=1881019 RepID=UPI000B83C0C4|nr:hypothetical protein [Streptomyces sp. TLI_105]
MRSETLAQLMVPEEATYQIEYDTTRAPGTGIAPGTEQRTAWTFRSKAPKGRRLRRLREDVPARGGLRRAPVILTGFDVPLSPLNQAAAGREFTFTTARANGYAGVPDVAGASVAVSYGDGTTWQNAEARLGDGGRHAVTVRHPALARTNGFVTLRVEVWDADGNRTTQTIKRAYGLR